MTTYEKYKSLLEDYYDEEQLNYNLQQYQNEYNKLYNQNYVDDNNIIKMNEDNLYQVMLNADIDSLNRLCQTTRKSRDICTNLHFWKQKYLHQLPVLYSDEPTTVNEWKKEYKKVYNIIKLINKILNLISKNEIYSRDHLKINMLFNNDEPILYLIPSIILLNMNDDYVNYEDDYTFLKMEIDYNAQKNSYTWSYDMIGDHDDSLYYDEVEINHQEVIEIMINVLYNYTEHEIKISLDI